MSRPQYVVLLTLAGSVILTVLAILGANLGLFGVPAQQSDLAKWGPAGALAEIVALFVFVAKLIFGKPSREPSLVIGPPEKPAKLREFDITRIRWVYERCFVVYGRDQRKPVKLVPSRAGRGFVVILPPELLDNIGHNEALELDLRDAKGNRWYVAPFLVNENLVRLSTDENIQKVIMDYADEEQ